MQFDFEAMSPAARFSFLTGAAVPRPVALITTMTPAGICNAAPYTFFSIAGMEPPMVTVTVLQTPHGRMKDTGANIDAFGGCLPRYDYCRGCAMAAATPSANSAFATKIPAFEQSGKFADARPSARRNVLKGPSKLAALVASLAMQDQHPN